MTPVSCLKLAMSVMLVFIFLLQRKIIEQQVSMHCKIIYKFTIQLKILQKHNHRPKGFYHPSPHNATLFCQNTRLPVVPTVSKIVLSKSPELSDSSSLDPAASLGPGGIYHFQGLTGATGRGVARDDLRHDDRASRGGRARGGRRGAAAGSGRQVEGDEPPAAERHRHLGLKSLDRIRFPCAAFKPKFLVIFRDSVKQRRSRRRRGESSS